MTQPSWNTPAGLIGNFSSLTALNFQLSASANLPADSLEYKIISGSLPEGLTMSATGLIIGTPALVISPTISTFVVRVTDNLQSIRDRTFFIEISGTARPEITTPPGTLLSTQDSIWIEIPIEFNNPVADNQVRIRLVQGRLPPGLEINDNGIIRGYAEPPIANFNFGAVTSLAIAISDNSIICTSTAGFSVDRSVVFTGNVVSGITAGQTYFIHSVINETTFTISDTVGGPALSLENDIVDMQITLPSLRLGQPTIQTFSFSLKLESDLGDDIKSYFIEVINQNTPVSQGGPGKGPNSRVPAIFNIRPPTFKVEDDLVNYRYYLLPPNSIGKTYNIESNIPIEGILSDNFFSFRIIGNDFDGNTLEYVYSDLPLELQGDPATGWITGVPIISNNSISEFSFTVVVRKKSSTGAVGLSSAGVTFTLRISEGIIGNIEWITPSDLGEIFNGTISTLQVSAKSDVNLKYRVVNGTLPPNLLLLEGGELIGKTSFQPKNIPVNFNELVPFSFTIEAFSPEFSIVRESRTFVVNVRIMFNQPTETLYIKCNPSLSDRKLLNSLLLDSTLIPDDVLYRKNDPNFGKAKEVTYEHVFGIFASNLEEYIAAITENHYWRQITLGEIDTAVARDESGNIIYEVVYSKIVDNLNNPNGQSISKQIFWPRFINLNKGPWYTSGTDIYTSYESDTKNLPFHTSLSPGFARQLYPNSLKNMRDQIGQTLGQEFDFRLLPNWMTSQQLNGSTLGYTPAWVIAYTKPGFSDEIRTNILTNWREPILNDINSLNNINFKIDRFTVDKSATFNFDKDINPAAWLSFPSATPDPEPKNSKDFQVLFGKKTILPTDSQYNK